MGGAGSAFGRAKGKREVVHQENMSAPKSIEPTKLMLDAPQNSAPFGPEDILMLIPTSSVNVLPFLRFQHATINFRKTMFEFIGLISNNVLKSDRIDHSRVLKCVLACTGAILEIIPPTLVDPTPRTRHAATNILMENSVPRIRGIRHNNIGVPWETQVGNEQGKNPNKLPELPTSARPQTDSMTMTMLTNKRVQRTNEAKTLSTKQGRPGHVPEDFFHSIPGGGAHGEKMLNSKPKSPDPPPGQPNQFFTTVQMEPDIVEIINTINSLMDTESSVLERTSDVTTFSHHMSTIMTHDTIIIYVHRHTTIATLQGGHRPPVKNPTFLGDPRLSHMKFMELLGKMQTPRPPHRKNR